MSDTERSDLEAELNRLHRQIADADNGKGPAIGNALRTQIYRRIDAIDEKLAPSLDATDYGWKRS